MLNQELQEIFEDTFEHADVEDFESHMLGRLASTMDESTGDALIFPVLSTFGTGLIALVESADELEMSPSDIIQAMLPEICRLALMMGLVTGREHYRRGYQI